MAELNDQINKVKDFHRSFGLPVEEQPVSEISEREFMLRFNLMKEENEEYLEACREGDLNGIADALGDMMYILFGTIVRHGLQDKMERVFEEIHQSNMSKLGHDGKPIYREDGKVLKGPNYFKPRIADLLGEAVI
jgi:predicted HAD superfamily Cof-like phosphohydrolase